MQAQNIFCEEASCEKLTYIWLRHSWRGWPIRLGPTVLPWTWGQTQDICTIIILCHENFTKGQLRKVLVVYSIEQDWRAGNQNGVTHRGPFWRVLEGDNLLQNPINLTFKSIPYPYFPFFALFRQFAILNFGIKSGSRPFISDSFLS